ncbi:type 2 lanthipeptide synthetase LanM family protein [uncultured Vagococcus sp.]|uniref:type 2 lanthipeptide synthetase LanM family protein n=1 Tax=uncultured Vagococcus sp. TaxID=189676 RepID=UPI0028D53B2C|nr:type 2 lanthipeptide synthetase LanM family protein [uncultured Vagococcus sp.]
MSTNLEFYYCSELITKFILKKNSKELESFEKNIASKFLTIIKSDLAMFCHNMIFEVLIDFYHLKRRKSLLRGSNTDQRTYEYSEYFKRHVNIEGFFSHYPLLYERLSSQLLAFCKYYSEIVDNYNENKSIIRAQFGMEFGEIKKIDLGVGDQHNGKSVAIVHFENGKLVYKPRNSNTDKFFYNFMDLCLSIGVEKERIGIDFRFPIFFSDSDYTWQEFIEHSNCLSFEEVQNYYYRAGCYLGVFYLLKSFDLHYENLIAMGEYPVFIDLETIIGASKDVSIETKMMGGKDLKTSVLSTSLLPIVDRQSPIDVNVSGLFMRAQTSKEIYITNVKKDDELDWIYTKENATIIPSKNQVVHGNSTVEPNQVSEYLIKGFSDILKKIFQNKTEIISTIMKWDLSNTISRQLLRPTRVYSLFISALNNPKVLKSRNEYNKILDVFTENFSAEKFGYLRLEDEIKQMENMSIPMFYTLLDERNLFNSNGELVCSDYYQETPIQTVTSNINNLDVEMINYQSRIIEMSLVTLSTPDEALVSKAGVKNSTLRTEIMTTKLEKEYFSNFDCNTFRIGEGAESYYSLIQIDKKNLIIKGTDFGLYDVGGNILFNLLYGSNEKDLDRIYIAEKLYSGLMIHFSKEYFNQNSDIFLDASVFSGIGGILYLAYYFNSILNDRKYFHDCELFVSIINNEVDNVCEIDFLTGLSSLALLLVRLHKNDRGLVDKALIIKIEKKLHLLYSTKKNTLDDSFSHGKSGVCAAFSSLYSITKNQETYNIIYDFYRRIIFTDNYSWCRGNAGILNSMIIVLEFIDKRDDLYKNTERKFLLEIRNYKKYLEIDNLSMCHGISGNISTLISASKYVESSFEINIVNDILNLRTPDLFTSEWYKGFKVKSDSFMLGIPGVIYAKNRLSGKYPSILDFELINDGWKED